MLPYEKLPHVTDPPTGWLQNANDPPWTVTWPLGFDPDSFPPYLSPRSMGFRPQRSAGMLLADSSVTFEELIEYKHSTRMELADRILPELLAAARARGDADARRAADVLERWDRQANADSRGAVLFVFWVRRWLEKAKGSPFARPWRLDSALTTPAGLEDPRAAVASLGEAARKVRTDYGALDVPWGDVMRIRYGGKDLASNGASGDPLGVFRVANYAPGDDGKFHLVAGDTWFAAIEFGNPVRAKVLLAYGNATQPGSRHRGDQLELFARKELRDVWRTRDEIERNLEEREELAR
jgi:acyl-homoserine-lactone acylase